MSNPALTDLSAPLPGWPRPPFDWPHQEAREAPGARACSIDTLEGRWLKAFVRDVDPRARDWFVAPKATGPFVALSLARVARVTLGAPLYASVLSEADGPAPLPVAEIECDYVLRTAAGRDVLRGRTVGHVDTDEGLFLFTAVPGEIALNRVFVPRAAQLQCEFGATRQGHAPVQWITDRLALRAAFSNQRHRRIPRIGEALTQLGFLTAAQVDQVLAQPGPRGRLGERLVAQGLVTPAQLETGLAFKLGYPLVDLARMPIDKSCVRLLAPEIARRHGAMPILLEDRQVVVAVDGPSSYAALVAADLLPGQALVPVFAPRSAILMALTVHGADDAWSQEAPLR
jgi:hypothetical protein